MLALAAITAAVLAGAMWLLLGKPDVTRTPPRVAPSGSPSSVPAGALTVAERLDAAKVVLAMVGGIGAIVVLTAGYRKQRNEDVAAYWEETKAFADRFATAVEMLGNGECAVRIGAVSALALLADEWPGGRQTCIDTLCGYLRLPYEPDPQSTGYSVGNREVRRLIIREIRNHLRDDWAGVLWRGYRFSFERAIFDCGDLSKAVFVGGNVTFHRAQFVSNAFEFDGVEFRGTGVHFGKSRYIDATVTFNKAVFDNCYVSFKGAEFIGGAVQFDAATFRKGEVTFEGAVHTNTNLTFAGASKADCITTWDALAPLVPAALQ